MTVFTPVQLIATQQASLAALFALTRQALRDFHEPVEPDFLSVKVVPEIGMTRHQETRSRTTPGIRAVRPARSHLSADPPTAANTSYLYDESCGNSDRE